MSTNRYIDKLKARLANETDRRLHLQALLDDQVARNRALLAGREWISVEERLPEAGRVVFAAVKGHTLPVPLRKNGPSPNPNRGAWDYIDGDTCRSTVSHWMPIPAMPALQGEQP